MNSVEGINKQIVDLKNNGVSTKNISDVYHTFRTLYEQRMVLFSALCNSNPNISWKSKKHFDEENDPMFNGDFVAGINTPNGVATYHFKLQYWDMFQVQELDRAPRYDGYTPEDVMDRIKSLTKKL